MARTPQFERLPTPRRSPMQIVTTTVVILAALIIIIGLLTTGFVVNAGNVGVVTTFGRVEEGVLYPGFHLRMPFVQQIHQIDVRVQPHPFKEIDAASKEQQTVKLTGMMNYHLDPARANELYSTVGLDFASKVIDPAFADYIKEVVPQYEAATILNFRDQIRSNTKEKLALNLQRYGIIVDDVYISNISFSPEYQAAIEQKQTQQQLVGREAQVLEQKKIQAQQKVADAQGDADAQIERARGEAEANRVRAASISPSLISYLQATKWDGKLPGVTSGAIPFFNVQPAADASATPGPAGAQPAATPTTGANR